MDGSKILYKQILKSTILFGSVQVFNIIVSILRSKAVAIFIGPAGVGIAGLLSATLDVVQMSTGMGLDTSGVKFISQANAQSDKTKVVMIINLLKRLMWIVGILASLLVVLFSSWLSKITFGNEDYRWSFVWISITLFVKNISNSRYAVLQGMGQLKYLAKANFYGSLFGLFATLPFYYYLKINAIVPAIIISSLLTMFIAVFYADKLNVEKVEISNKQLLSKGRDLISLGFTLSISGLMTTASTYFLQLYIGSNAGIGEVGLYIAGTTLLNTYVGIVFTSMSTDYYPRLSAISHLNDQVRITVEHQALVAILIITPIICLFIPLAPLFVKIFYSSEFLSIVPMIIFGIVGMLFRAVSWSMGYILLAKGDSNLFVKTALGFNSLFLIMNVTGFYFYGLLGLGMSFTLYYFSHFLALKIITFKMYNFYFNKEFYGIYVICSFFCISAFLFDFVEYGILRIIMSITVAIVASLFSAFYFNKKLGWFQVFNKLKKK